MIKNEKIGIIGLGYVGSAIKQSYIDNPFINLIEIDIDPSKNCTGKYEDLFDASAVFVCVPSPQKSDGSCDSEPLELTLSKLKDFKGVIISKVTAPPDVYKKLEKEFPNLVYSPEFLTAANAINDYLNSKFLIVGGSVNAYLHEADRIIRKGLQGINITHFCNLEEASLTKYTINSFLATKVVFMNEMAKLAEISGINWETVRQLIALDEHRIGNSHTQVPGPDNLYGFGGACFPKDTAALLKYAENLAVSMNVLDSAIKKNILLRLGNSK